VKTAELLELAKVVGEQAAVLTVHLRDERRGVSSAVGETLDIARYSSANLEISHFKFRGPASWPYYGQTMKEIDKAAKEGINVNFDIYPYAHTGSVLYAYLPDWVAEGGNAKLLKRLKDKSQRPKIIKDLREEGYDLAKLRLAATPHFSQSIGRTMQEIAAEQEVGVEEAVLNTLIANQGKVIVFDKTRRRDLISRLIKHPLSLIASDGFGVRFEGEAQENLVHPRAFGTFPRILARYVRERKDLSWEEAISKMTGKPAEKFGIQQRGILREGFAADVTVIDPEQIQDLATISNPFQYARGVKYVLVNGQLVVADGLSTGGRPGMVLRRP
jgi:N-acyl-D-amino-acid deacylase